MMSKAIPFSVVSEFVKETTDRKFLRDQLISLFFPSRDATGIGLSGLFFNLARHPHVWTTVREEVMASLGPEQPLTFENLKSLRCLHSVLNESVRESRDPHQCPNQNDTLQMSPVSADCTQSINSTFNIGLRLLSPASMGARVYVNDTGDSPIFIQAGTKVDMNFGVMQRDPDFRGHDAEEFRPERWQSVRPKWEYIPFLGGGRMCPAQQMVLNQMGFVLPTFVRRFEGIENRDEAIKFVE